MYTPNQRDILVLLAAELDAACAQIERLAMALRENVAVARNHLIELQSLDHINQRCASISAILRLDDLEAASPDARLEIVGDGIAQLLGAPVCR